MLLEQEQKLFGNSISFKLPTKNIVHLHAYAYYILFFDSEQT